MKTPGRMFLSMALVLVAACSGGESRRGPALEVEAGWARAMPFLTEVAGGASNSAVYFVIRNRGDEDDRLLGGDSPVSAKVEVHETRMVNDVMRMRELGDLEVPAFDSVELAPGGIHLMLTGLSQTLQEGDSVELTLRFEKSGAMVVFVPVRLMGEG